MAASASTMVKGRANFYVDDNTSLNHANCYFPLDQGAIVAAFPEKILIGPTDLNENGEMCFSKDKTIIIPSSRLVEFVKTVCKGYNALKTNSKEEFEDTIFIYQNTYYLVSKYQFWQGEFGFTMFYQRKHGADTYHQKQVSEGKRDPVDVSKLDDPEFVPRKRSVFNLKINDLELLIAHLDILFRYLSYDVDTNKSKVLEFIEYATSEEKHIKFLEVPLKNYSTLSLEEKIKILRTILTDMLTDKKQPQDSFALRNYLNVLTRQRVPVFALLHFHLIN